MLSSAACGKENGGDDNGASLPGSRRVRLRRNRSHCRLQATSIPVSENYKPIATGPRVLRRVSRAWFTSWQTPENPAANRYGDLNLFEIADSLAEGAQCANR